jgi:LacI family transcriptional regulator
MALDSTNPINGSAVGPIADASVVPVGETSLGGKQLRQVTSQPGRPLYLTVRDAVRAAIDAGVFQPGQQMPSTKDLSEQLEVSLVTTHRALQELVASGVLRRSQGRGTFVHHRYHDKTRSVSTCRVGLVFHREASLADYYHSQVLEGVRQAANQLAVDLMLLRFGEDVRNECNGYLFLNPLPGETDALEHEGRKQPSFVVGARPHNRRICSIDVDNVDLGRQAVLHLLSLGHKNISYVGGDDQTSNSSDRWLGFSTVMRERGLTLREPHVIKGESWRLTEREQMALIRSLSSPQRPTAIFAAGYYFALDVYAAASTVGLKVPEQLSIVGVDDPPSAAHLSPPLTTLRQPLVQLGHAAVTALVDQIQRNPAPDDMLVSRTLWAELVIRRSSAAPPDPTDPSSPRTAF